VWIRVVYYHGLIRLSRDPSKNHIRFSLFRGETNPCRGFVPEMQSAFLNAIEPFFSLTTGTFEPHSNLLVFNIILRVIYGKGGTFEPFIFFVQEWSQATLAHRRYESSMHFSRRSKPPSPIERGGLTPPSLTSAIKIAEAYDMYHRRLLAEAGT
jgi:hypothetical protein